MQMNGETIATLSDNDELQQHTLFIYNTHNDLIVLIIITLIFIEQSLQSDKSLITHIVKETHKCIKHIVETIISYVALNLLLQKHENDSQKWYQIFSQESSLTLERKKLERRLDEYSLLVELLLWDLSFSKTYFLAKKKMNINGGRLHDDEHDC